MDLYKSCGWVAMLGLVDALGGCGGSADSDSGDPAAGAFSAAGNGGSTATSRGGAGGAAGCIDVCALYGTACCVWTEDCIPSGNHCQIDLLDGTMGIPYEYAELEEQIAGLSGDILLTILDTDIQWAAADDFPSARIQLHLTPEASARLEPALDSLSGAPFRVSCNGQSLFVGVGYELWGAAALRIPVLHLSTEADETLTLWLGAWQGACLGMVTSENLEERARIDRLELRAVFCERGAERVLDPDTVPTSR